MKKVKKAFDFKGLKHSLPTHPVNDVDILQIGFEWEISLWTAQRHSRGQGNYCQHQHFKAVFCINIDLTVIISALQS